MSFRLVVCCSVLAISLSPLSGFAISSAQAQVNEAAQAVAEAVAFEVANWSDVSMNLHNAWAQSEFKEKSVTESNAIVSVSLNNESGRILLKFSDGRDHSMSKNLCDATITMMPQYEDEHGDYQNFEKRTETTSLGSAVDSMKKIAQYNCVISLSPGKKEIHLFFIQVELILIL